MKTDFSTTYVGLDARGEICTRVINDAGATLSFNVHDPFFPSRFHVVYYPSRICRLADAVVFADLLTMSELNTVIHNHLHGYLNLEDYVTMKHHSIS